MKITCIAMNLPEYKAIQFQQILEKGGHSKPWIVLVELAGMVKPYVVKLYKTADIEARNKMTAEVLGNVLAAEFNLKAPSAAIIDFPPAFCAELNEQCEDILLQIDGRPKFGSEYLEGSFLYNPKLSRSLVKKIIEPANLYAYDYFIGNGDRTLNKPNLLIRNNESYLIDHEMALDFNPYSDDLWTYIYRDRFKYHVFNQFLRKYRDKENLFDEFIINLHDLNLRKFDSYFSQLEYLGFATQQELIIDYWRRIKEKPDIFAYILKESIK